MLDGKRDEKSSPEREVGEAPTLHSLIAGGVAGLCTVAIGHPFDTLKVRQQTANKGAHRGIWDLLFQAVVKERSLRGFYAGVSAPLVGQVPSLAVSFWGFEVGKRLMHHVSSTHSDMTLTGPPLIVAGAFSAILEDVVTTPVEQSKILLQTQGRTRLTSGLMPPQYKGCLDALLTLYKLGGLQKVYSAYGVTLLRDAPANAIFYPTYDTVKNTLTPRGPDGRPLNNLHWPSIMAAGAISGITTWTAILGIDTVKSRMQNAQGRFSMWETSCQMFETGGIRAFYKGLPACLLRAGFANAFSFLGMEMTKSALDKRRVGSEDMSD